MADRLGMAFQLAGNAARFGWYSGVGWLAAREARALGAPPRYRPRGPVPERGELMASLRALLVRDAELVRDGIVPPLEDEPGGLGEHLARVRAMFADLPATVARRANDDAASAKSDPASQDLPAYFTQDFHFQTGGYLSDQSARLYDVQVETLFNGSAAAMRRAGLRPIVEFLRGRDQRQMALLDVACGTGRLLKQIRLACPALALTGLDLSPAYLREAAEHLAGLRPAAWIAGNAEKIPLPDASQDIVTTVFLYHELPPDVRRTVTREIARVLKPGGLFVFIDSLQMDDRQGWNGLLEAFPERFHEPYYRHYAIDDLDGMFSAAGLAPRDVTLAFLSKVVTRIKA